MALGDNSYDNNTKKKKNVEVYSKYKYTNPNGIDPSSLNFTFKLGMLVIIISPKKPDSDYYDHDKAIEIYLSHTKAKNLADEIRYFMSHPNEVNNVGIATGSDGLIILSNGKEYGIDHPVLMAAKIDANGRITSSYAYEFKTNYYYGIRNYDPKNPSQFEKVYHDNTELSCLLNILDDYSRASSYAFAHANLEVSRFEHYRTQGRVSSLLEHFGIKVDKPNYSKRGNNGGSYFNNNNGSSSSNSSYSSSSLDDYMAAPEDEGYDPEDPE